MNEIRMSHQIRQQDKLVPRFLSREKLCRDWGSFIFVISFFSCLHILGIQSFIIYYDPFLIKCLFTLVFTCWFKSIGAFLDSCFLSLNYIFFHVLLDC